MSLKERIEKNDREISKLKGMMDEIKNKYYVLNNNYITLLEKYNIEISEKESLKEENLKMKSIIDCLIDETLIDSPKLKSTVNTIYNEAIFNYAISSLGTIYKK